MAEFAEADVEAARMLDTEYGRYPYDEDELADASTRARRGR